MVLVCLDSMTWSLPRFVCVAKTLNIFIWHILNPLNSLFQAKVQPSFTNSYCMVHRQRDSARARVPEGRVFPSWFEAQQPHLLCDRHRSPSPLSKSIQTITMAAAVCSVLLAGDGDGTMAARCPVDLPHRPRRRAFHLRTPC